MAKGTWIALGVLGGIALVALGIVGSAVGTYNSFVQESEGIDAQGKQVDVQYQTAFRKVPQLVNLTEQYMRNEADVMTQAAALRSGLVPAGNGTFDEKDAYAAQLANFIALIAARAENYPELRASNLFIITMDEIVNTENKIAMEKVRFNDRVQEYNAHRRECCIPLWIAGAFGFDENDYIGYTDRPNQSTFPQGTQL